VPFHIAFELSADETATFRFSRAERIAVSMMLQEFEGQQYDWSTLRPIKRG
jgi:hypothetical protein